MVEPKRPGSTLIDTPNLAASAATDSAEQEIAVKAFSCVATLQNPAYCRCAVATVFSFENNEVEGVMRRLVTALATAFALIGTTAIAANAQAQYPGAGAFHALIKNATPVEQAACRGWGPYCPPGFTRVCGPYRCWCRPCR